MCDAVRVLLLTWEYPPLVVGGLGRHVEALARELAAGRHHVRVVTRGEASTSSTEERDGVVIHRAATDPLAIDFTTESLLAWAQANEHSLLRAALPLVRDWHPDVVHAHDWLVGQTAITVAEATGASLVTTIHGTEAGRHQGRLPQPLNRAIHSVERWLTGRSAAVITCSAAMRAEVLNLFELPGERVTVIGNGIDAPRWRPSAAARRAARARLGEDGPLLVFAGRLVHEKGVQTLLDALPALRDMHPGLRLAVAGTGPYEAALRRRARQRRVARTVRWLGFVAEAELAAVLGAADLVVLPSTYEPFGIVALEAAVAGAPLVVAETGGLADLVAAGVPAASFPPGDAAELSTAVAKLLADPDDTRRDADRAARVVRRNYSWEAVARRTAQTYDAVSSSPAGP